MPNIGPIAQKRKHLAELADSQNGYFTCLQACRIGYDRSNFAYYLENIQWEKVLRGLFRLPGHPDTMESDFTKWCLWSRNQKDQPQGAISHNSALALYGFYEYNPREIHMTVPLRFQKIIPDDIMIHLASLSLSAIESRSCFMVTRLGQTLVDMRTELEINGEWDGIIEKLMAEDKLSREELIKLGLSSAPEMASDSKIASKIYSTQTPGDLITQNKTKIAAQPTTENVFDPLSEGVWKMMYERAEAGTRRSKAGFTLVELLVVIAILSIMAGLLLPVLNKEIGRAHV